MPSFPFFRLPILTQLLVLKHLGLLELFYLSLISKHFEEIVKSLNVTLSKFNWDLLSNVCTVELIHPNCTGLYSSFHSDDMIMTPSEQISVNGTDVQVTREQIGSHACLYIQTTSMRESWEAMDKFTEYFLELFKVSKFEVILPVVPNFRSWFMWKYTKRFETVRVTDWEDNCTLSSDDVKFMLEELTIDDELDIRVSVEEGVRYSGPLKMKELWVMNGDWLTLETILNMDCEKLYFHFGTITYQDLNAIIKKWLTGGLKNVVYLGFYGTQLPRQDSTDTKLDRVLEGVEHFPYDANSRPENVCVDFKRNRYYYNFRNGRDIRRSDGTIATVDFIHNHFVFYVWNHLSVIQ